MARDPQTDTRPQPPALRMSTFFAFSVVYLVAILWIPTVEARLDPLTGDEPFYVMTSISLVRDHDLNELNNYADRDYDTFYPALGPTPRGWQGYPDPLPPHATHTRLPGLYSKHGLGLSLVIALPWELGGRTLTLIVLAAIAGLVCANACLLAEQVGVSPWVALAVSLLLSLTNPLLSFSLLIFPEMTSALCIVYATRQLLAPTRQRWQWFLTGFALAFLPWLHYRLAPISLALAVAAVLRLRLASRFTDWIAFAFAPLVAGTALFAWYWHLYGSPLPPQEDHAGFSDLFGTVNGFAGTLYDQQWGALIHNPLLALAVIAIVPFTWKRGKEAALLASVCLPYLVVISAYRIWWGEWNPPGRYLTDIVPLAAAPLAWWLSTLSGRVRVVLLAVAAIPALAVMITFVQDPQLMYNQPDGSSRLLETWSGWLGWDLTALVPSYVFYSAWSVLDRAWFAGAASLVLILVSAVALIDSIDRHPVSVPTAAPVPDGAD